MGVDLRLQSHEFRILFLHFNDVVIFYQLSYLPHHLGKRGVKNADFIAAQMGILNLKIAAADRFYFVKYDGKALIYAGGKKNACGQGDAHQDQDTYGKGPVEGVNAFQGIGIGKIIHGAEAGGGIGACQIYSVRIRKI